MSNLYSIWTFDLRTRKVPLDSPLKATYPECVFWEACTDGWSRDRCETKAKRLSERHNAPFIVRRKLTNGKWTDPTDEEWQRGIAHVEHVAREQDAVSRQKALQRRLTHSGAARKEDG